MYNYNKKIETNEKIDKNTYKKLLLLNEIIDKFPKTIITSKNKTELKSGINRRNLKNIELFLNNEYIYFNEETFNFLIIDIDNKKRGINDIIIELDEHFIAPPTYIIETEKGWQVGFMLEKPFIIKSEYQSESDKKAEKYATYVLNNIYILLGGDPVVSHRLRGFFRNPVGQPNSRRLFFNLKNKFNLSDFDINIPGIEKTELNKNKGNTGGKFHEEDKKIKMLATELIKGNIEVLNQITEGLRNGFFWYVGMYISKTNKENWEEILDNYNINLTKKIEESEMDNIKKSIKKYNREGKNRVNLEGYSGWTPELKKMYMKEYRLKKGIVKRSREKQKEEYKNKVIQAIYKLIEKGEKLTNNNIVKVSKISLATVKRKKKELLKIPHFKKLFEK